MKDSGFLTAKVIAEVRSRFRLDWLGLHGAPHWERVRINGLELAARNGADVELVELFSILHDAERRSDGWDLEHGARSAARVLAINDRLLHLDQERLQMLVVACRDHSLGYTEGELTVRTCWDADRLDLGRIGVRPEPGFLCTTEGREPEVIERAWRRSRSSSAEPTLSELLVETSH